MPPRRTDGCRSRYAITSARIAHDHLVIDRRDHALEPLTLGSLARGHTRRERSKRSAVVQVRQRDDITLRGQPLGHARELRPDAEPVHVEHDRGPGTGAGLRAEHMQVQHAVVGFQIDPLDTHLHLVHPYRPRHCI